ncbi:annexin A13-like [Antedon mediterranea]|uniref:annexin A13-like n=1 Tax=Antedon mediterranea TaxID=105859 RepID=UPI003AF5C205
MLSMPRTVPAFPACSNRLQKKWNDRAYKLHLQKMNRMKHGLDTKKPKTFYHMQINMKKIQAEEQRQAVIDYENRILLAKLTNVLRSNGHLDNWNWDYEPKSLNGPFMEREQEKIAQQNSKIQRRLNNVNGVYDSDKWEDEYLMHEYYLSQKTQETKSYEIDTRGFEGLKISNEDDTGDKQEEEVQQESIKPSPEKRMLKKQPTKLPTIGNLRKKEQEKKKKKEFSKPKEYDDGEDSTKLFRVIKGLGQTQKNLIEALVRRTYAQRHQTKVKFQAQYKLDLETELRTKLGEDYDAIFDALLKERQTYDALCLNHALLTHSYTTMVEILCTRNNKAISLIKDAYKMEFDQTIEDGIKDNFSGDSMKMMLALAKGARRETGSVDEEEVESDVDYLIDAGDSRWNVEGQLLNLMENKSFEHIGSVFQRYTQKSGQNLKRELQNVLAADMKVMMLTLVKCFDNCVQYFVDVLHSSLKKGDNLTVLRIITTRAEIDLVLIRREYKRRYGVLLEDDVDRKCTGRLKKMLVHMISVHAPAITTTNETHNTKTKSVRLPKFRPPPKMKPLHKPTQKKTVRIASANPLLSTSPRRSPRRSVNDKK